MNALLSRLRPGRMAAGLVLLGLVLWPSAGAHAQDAPSQRQIRTYVPPEQLVSFLPSTPFDQFVEFLNPIFEKVTGKQVIDPGSQEGPIGISIAGMHFFDALELVLEFNGLTYRETDRYFIIEKAQPVANDLGPAQAEAQAGTAAPAGTTAARPATLGTREIQINAILFDLNQSLARDIGIDWNTLFGNQSGSTGGSDGGSDGGDGENTSTPRFFLKTDKIFGGLDDLIESPERIEFTTLTQLFRFLETEGVGQTIANPSVTVQSGQQGRIQIGADIPINTRDFAGNTITQFLNTGIIIQVTPTLLTEPLEDTTDAPLLDFIHMNVTVDKSSSRPSLSGPVVDRNTASTQVLLLDGEQTIIGGLYSTEESTTRRGIPILKDLPGWFFGLRYLFGYTQRTMAQKELLIVLQARMLDPLEMRAQRPFEDNLLERRRRQVRENIGRVDPGLQPRFNENPPVQR